MELQCLLGIKCDKFAMIAADQMRINSIIVLKDDDEKLYKISDRLVMGVMGDQGDTSQFVQYVAKSIQLYRMKNMYPLDIEPVAHFTRQKLVEARLKCIPYALNFVLIGYDDKVGGQLYFLDPLGTCIKAPYISLGFGGMLSFSIMDWYYKPTMTEADAYALLKLCTEEIHKRLFVKLPRFQVTMVSGEGVKQLPPIVPGSNNKQ